MRFDRKNLLKKFHQQIKENIPIIGGGAGTGLSAKGEEAGGIDLIVIYNSGRYRMAGRGSLAGLLAYGNANEIVLDMAREVLPVIKHTPALAGVNRTDPFCNFDFFLDHIRALGFAGIQNFPTVGLIDGTFRILRINISPHKTARRAVRCVLRVHPTCGDGAQIGSKFRITGLCF